MFAYVIRPDNSVVSFTLINAAQIYCKGVEGARLVINETDLDVFSGSQLVALYNAGLPEDKHITKFSDKETARRRTFESLSRIASEGAVEKKGKKPSNGKRGRPSKLAGKFLYKLTEQNPRRENTHGWHAWNLITNGMKYEDYLKAGESISGGPLKHLVHDINRGYTEARDA